MHACTPRVPRVRTRRDAAVDADDSWVGADALTRAWRAQAARDVVSPKEACTLYPVPAEVTPEEAHAGGHIGEGKARVVGVVPPRAAEAMHGAGVCERIEVAVRHVGVGTCA